MRELRRRKIACSSLGELKAEVSKLLKAHPSASIMIMYNDNDKDNPHFNGLSPEEVLNLDVSNEYVISIDDEVLSANIVGMNISILEKVEK